MVGLLACLVRLVCALAVAAVAIAVAIVQSYIVILRPCLVTTGQSPYIEVFQEISYRPENSTP